MAGAEHSKSGTTNESAWCARIAGRARAESAICTTVSGLDQGGDRNEGYASRARAACWRVALGQPRISDRITWLASWAGGGLAYANVSTRCPGVGPARGPPALR